MNLNLKSLSRPTRIYIGAIAYLVVPWDMSWNDLAGITARVIILTDWPSVPAFSAYTVCTTQSPLYVMYVNASAYTPPAEERLHCKNGALGRSRR